MFADISNTIEAQLGNCPVLLETLHNFCDSLRPIVAADATLVKTIETLCTPASVKVFKIQWINTRSEVCENEVWRCDYNFCLGPSRGGVRLHHSTNLDIVCALAFHTVLQNAVTNLPMGGCFTGSNFNAKDHTDEEIKNFANALMAALRAEIPANWPIDITADLGCGQRETSLLVAAHQGVRNSETGKPYPIVIGRPCAAGLGAVEFAKRFCRLPSFDRTRCIISGAGNCALAVAKNLIVEGAKVLSLSDSSGYIYAKNGLLYSQWQRINEYQKDHICLRDMIFEDSLLKSLQWESGNVWQSGMNAEYAFPSAYEREIDSKRADHLIKTTRLKAVIEVSYMSCTGPAFEVFHAHKVKVCPFKCTNVGAMAALGLNLAESIDKADFECRVKTYMHFIHDQCRATYEKFYPHIWFEEAVDITAFYRLEKYLKERD